MYTMRDFLMDYLKDHSIPTVVDYTRFMEEHEYHMMKSLMLSEDKQKKVIDACKTMQPALQFYVADWSHNKIALLTDYNFYPDEVIGAAVYCYLELFDVVYGKKTYLLSGERSLQVSENLIIVDNRKDYKADFVVAYAKERKYHKPHIMVFDAPAVKPWMKYKMRLKPKYLGPRWRGWVLYLPYGAHHESDWRCFYTPATERINKARGNEVNLSSIKYWEMASGRLFNPAEEWYKAIQQTVDPAHFAEEPIRPRGATIFEPQRLIRNKKDE